MIGGSLTNILVVDDERYICSIIQEALASEKYCIKALSDPAQALEYIEQHPVDLVLTDLIMGEHSGIQVLETTLRHHGDAIVILMTAHPTLETAISVLTRGAYDFLVKPFRLELLKATVKRGLDHQRVLRENLQLKGQVEFLKVVGATGAEVHIKDILMMVARSCKKEMAAAAVGIIETDPASREPISRVHESDDESLSGEVLDDSTIENFTYTKSTQPVIQGEETGKGAEALTRIFISQPLFARRRLHGVINILIRSRFDQFTPGQLDVLSILANSAAASLANHRLYQDLRTSYIEAIRALANAIEARDACTAGHTDRVSAMAELVARHMGWDEHRISDLVMGCSLHDIGKIGVPDSILNKPGKLTDHERKQMEAHPEVGLMIIDGIDLFRPAIPYITAHHESYDGSGYPNGLKGDAIPIEGRLLAVVDTFEAIMSNRPYRKGADLRQAVSELVKYKGIQFDAEIVDIFIDVIRQGKIDFQMLYNRDEDLSQLDAIAVSEKEPA